MQRPTQIVFRGMSSSPALEERIHEGIAALDQRFRGIQNCRVVVQVPPQHSRKGGVFDVTIELSVTGSPPIIAGRSHHASPDHTDVYVALRDALDAAKRQLADLGEMRREPRRQGGIDRLET